MVNIAKYLVGIVMHPISGWYGYVPNIWLVWLCTQYLVGIVMYPISGWYGYVPNIWLVWLISLNVWLV